MVGITKRKVQQNKKLVENLQEAGANKTGPLFNEVERKLRKQIQDAYYLDEQWRMSLWRISFVMIVVMGVKLYENYKIENVEGRVSNNFSDFMVNDLFTFINDNRLEFLNIIIGICAVKFIGKAQALIYQQPQFYFGMGIVLFQFSLFLSTLYSLFEKYQTLVRNNENQAKIDGETLFLGDEKKAWSEFLSYIKTQFPVVISRWT